MANNSNNSITKEEFNDLSKRFPPEKVDEMLLTGLLIPGVNKVSGPRAQLVSNHIKKSLVLTNAEVPYVYTGKELAFGRKSTGHKQADSDYIIVARIDRHTDQPGLKYLLVVQDMNTSIYDVVEVNHVESLSENYGFMKQHTRTDFLPAGEIIRKGEYFFKSPTMDEYGNYCFGTNAKAAYVNTMDAVADAVFISDEFAKKTSFHLIEEVEILLNSNDLLLNIHGDANNYKLLPCIGESISAKGMLCARRKIDFTLAASNLTNTALMTPVESDDIFRGRGVLVDIDIYVNKSKELLENKDPYRAQLAHIYRDQLRYYKAIYDVLDPIIKRQKYKHPLMHTYNLARNYITDVYLESNQTVTWSANKGKFEFVQILMKVAFEKHLEEGDKISNRSAAKGVISAIIPKEHMFRDADGNYADICFAGKGIIGRLNISQTYEHELNFIANKIAKRIKELDNLDDKYKLLIEFIGKISKDQEDEIRLFWRNAKKSEKEDFMKTIEIKEQIYIYQPPFHNNLTLEQLAHLYEYYQIKPECARFRMEFPSNVFHDENYLNESQLRQLEIMKQYMMPTTDAEKAKFRADYEAYKNQKRIVKSSSGKEYIQGKTFTYKDYKNKGAGSKIYDMIKNGAKVLRSKFKQMSREEFLSPKSHIIKTEDGKIIRDFRTTKPLIIADVYIMVLKEIAESGFSARSLGPVSHLGLAVKSGKVNVGYPYPDSSIKFSFMDICNVACRVPMELVHRFKSIHASNPELRLEMAETLLTKDPYRLHNLSVKLEETYNDIPARMWKAYLWGLGIGFLNSDEQDIFDQFDDPAYANLDKIFRKHGTIYVDKDKL